MGGWMSVFGETCLVKTVGPFWVKAFPVVYLARAADVKFE